MIGRKLGSFRIDAQLAGDAPGAIYRAVDESTGRSVIIKASAGEEGRTLARFRRSLEILERFRHPNIARFLAGGRYRGTTYFAREYVDGPTLGRAIAERGALPWPEVIGLGLQIAEALRHVHQRGVVHRNLNPSHVMLAEGGRVKLIGFGLAKALDLVTPLATSGMVLGTPSYVAPEQIRGTPAATDKSDLYALGAVFYEMLTGRPVFEGPSARVLMHRHLTEPPPRPGARVSRLPAALDGLILRLMAKDPLDRPEDAAEVARVLSEVREDGRGKPARRPPPDPPRDRLWRRLLRRGPRQIARDAAPDPGPEGPLWDRDLDA